MATWAVIAAEAPDVAAAARVGAASGVGGMIESVSREPLIELDLWQVEVAWWLDIGLLGTGAVRRQWRTRYAS